MDRQKKRQYLSYALYLLLACVLVLGVTYARYRTTVTGTGTASVAKVALNSTADLSNALKGITPGKSVNIDVKVSNAKDNANISEVTQDYTITVETTGNLPLEFTLASKENGETTGYVNTSATAGSQGNKTVWEGGKMPHTTATTHEYTLTVKWKAAETDAKYADEIDKITLTVDAKQTQ